MGDDVAPVTVIGLGNLGLPIATRLLRRGRDVVGCDLDTARLAAFRETGGTAVRPEDLRPRPLACLVVPDDAAVESLLTAPDRLLSPGGPIVQHSTVSPELARRLAEDCRAQGYGYVDAPVSGGADRAADGTLAIMVGAAAEDQRRAEALLADLGKEVIHLGGPGAGSAAKLANQLMLFATLSGAYEAIEIAGRYGLAESAVLRAVGTGTGRSWVSDTWGFYDRLTRDYDAAGVPEAARPWAKDPAQAVAAAAAVGLDAPLAGLIAERLPGQVRRHADATGAEEST